ncbi:Phosphoethanolamine N-methyltransferase 1 [Amphibalanus amphitrite]|uniref:phosphoethanolamine N-methyltransferase n=1 Tax=Amphibalanus amphitrite TaxID=1232801 RepID=A0A6A4WDP0_AMPAM|nr:phosphomethylethanolamine N-methyltransferase-like [Amphibalanus amphitrite]KAF0303339.1 Phosphoethanolamine N-methyltransferase 1 [Amphibalanus amphitrite]
MAAPAAQNASQQFLDDNQYTRNNILRYEKIFGETFVSTGGLQTTQEFCGRLNLSPGQRVLDVGVGTGGSAFFMARQFGCHVTGVDLSKNMVDIAEERRRQLSPELQSLLEFQVGDVTKVDYPAGSFDVVYTRDTVLHIADKAALYANCLRWLRPAGILLVTDYCQGDRTLSEQFVKYRDQRGYHLLTVPQYGEVLRKVGFQDVEAIDNSASFLDILRAELDKFVPQKEEFVKEFSQKDFDDIVSGWTAKIERVSEGSQTWGLFVARKPKDE